jgi:hypothetical protein
MNQEHDDITNTLKDMAHIIDETQGKAVVTMLSGDMFSEAADEIDYLRQMCEELAHALTCHKPHCTLNHTGLHKWQKYNEELSANTDTPAAETNVHK